MKSNLALAILVLTPGLASAQNFDSVAVRSEVEQVFHHMRQTAREGDAEHFKTHLPETYQSDRQLHSILTAPLPWSVGSILTSPLEYRIFTRDSVGVAVNFRAGTTGSFSGTYVRAGRSWVLSCWIQQLPATQLDPGCEAPGSVQGEER